MFSGQSIKTVNESFNFDWNDYRTFESNTPKVPELELFIKGMLPFLDILEESDKDEFAQLCYKVGTFYNHIERAPAEALKKLSIAAAILKDNELAWTKIHIAFSYQQLLFAYKKENNAALAKESATSAMDNYKQVIKQYENIKENEAIKIIAFAYCVKALTEYEINLSPNDVASYRFALDLYEKNGLLDDQYARAKNRYAQILVERENDVEANKAFEELKMYWCENQDKCNPYPDRFHAEYADYLAKHSDVATKLYASSANLLYFKPVSNTKGVVSTDPSPSLQISNSKK